MSKTAYSRPRCVRDNWRGTYLQSPILAISSGFSSRRTINHNILLRNPAAILPCLMRRSSTLSRYPRSWNGSNRPVPFTTGRRTAENLFSQVEFKGLRSTSLRPTFYASTILAFATSWKLLLDHGVAADLQTNKLGRIVTCLPTFFPSLQS